MNERVITVHPHNLQMLEKEDLFAYLRDTAGLSPPSHTKAETLIGKIKDYWAENHMFQQELSEEANTVESIGSEQYQKWHRILIPFGGDTDQGARRTVPVSVNGHTITIPRNQEIDVPAAHVEALRNAVKVKIDPVTGEHFSTPRFGFSIIERDIPPEQRTRSLKHKAASTVKAPAPMRM